MQVPTSHLPRRFRSDHCPRGVEYFESVSAPPARNSLDYTVGIGLPPAYARGCIAKLLSYCDMALNRCFSGACGSSRMAICQCSMRQRPRLTRLRPSAFAWLPTQHFEVCTEKNRFSQCEWDIAEGCLEERTQEHTLTAREDMNVLSLRLARSSSDRQPRSSMWCMN